MLIVSDRRSTAKWVQRSSTVGTPSFGMCCDHSKVKMKCLSEPAVWTLTLEFRTHLTQCNAALAFTSLDVSGEAQRVGFLNPGEPPSFIRLGNRKSAAKLHSR
jgi:hypothetical protein